MSSQTRTQRGDGNGIDLRTLVIASIASAVAAIVVSRFWTSGTPIAAAMTPVVVTILKEVLDRPTSKIAERLTVDTKALRETEVREPVGSRVGRDPRPASTARPTRRMSHPAEPGAPDAPRGADPGDIRVYRQQPTGPVARRINPRVVLLTALLAFLIAGVVITAGQVAIGNPFGDDGKGAIILGQHKKKSSTSEQDQQNTTTTPEQQQTTSTPDQQQTTPQQNQQQTTTTPAPTQTSPQAAPRTGGTPTTPATPGQ